ncbi:MAG: hypothetical protein AAGA43_15470 [Bacteroidota bacterium]
MNLYNYLMLSEHDQAMALASQGKFVALYDNGNTRFQLFSLSTFFYEMEQDKKTKKLVGRRIFQSGRQLDKYIPDSKMII